MYKRQEVCSDGLTITLLPQARAAEICPIRIATGKFHGLMQRNLPFGLYEIMFSSPVGPSSFVWFEICII